MRMSGQSSVAKAFQRQTLFLPRCVDNLGWRALLAELNLRP